MTSPITKYMGLIGPGVTSLPKLAYNTDVIDLAAPLCLLNDRIRMQEVDTDEVSSEVSSDELVTEVSEQVEEALEGEAGEEVSASLSKLSSIIGEGVTRTINTLKNDVNPKVMDMMGKIDAKVAERRSNMDATTRIHHGVVSSTAISFEVVDWNNMFEYAGGKSEILSKWQAIHPAYSGSPSLVDFHNAMPTFGFSFSNIHLHDDTKELLKKQLNNAGLTRDESATMVDLMIDATSLNQMFLLDCLNIYGSDYSRSVKSAITLLRWHATTYRKYLRVQLDLDDNLSAKFHEQNSIVDKAIIAINYLMLCLDQMYTSNNSVAISDAYLHAPVLKAFLDKGLTTDDIRKNVYFKYTMQGTKLPSIGLNADLVEEQKPFIDEQMDQIAQDIAEEDDAIDMHHRIVALQEVADEYAETTYLDEDSEEVDTVELLAKRRQHNSVLHSGINQLGHNPNVSVQSILYDLLLHMEHSGTKVALAHRYFNEETIATISDEVSEDDSTEVTLNDDDIGAITTAVAARLAVDFLHDSKIVIPV